MNTMNSMIYHYTAKLVRVIDGDSLVLDIDLGFSTYTLRHVRLIGINAPELRTRNPIEKQAGHAAKAHIEKLLTGRLTVTSRQLDKFGRVLGVVFSELKDGTHINVNDQMIVDGHATAYVP